MSKPATEKSKITKRAHFEQIQKAKRKRDPGYIQPELVLPPLSPLASYLWELYQDVQNGERLTYQEIQAWLTLTKRELAPEEIAAIRNVSFHHYNARNSLQ